MTQTNDLLNDFADIQAAKEQFDYLDSRLDAYVKHMEEASKVRLKLTSDTKNSGSFFDVSKNNAAAEASIKKVEVSLSAFKSTSEKTSAVMSVLNGHSKEFIGNLNLMERAEKTAAQTKTELAKAAVEEAKATEQSAKANLNNAKAATESAKANELLSQSALNEAKATTESAKAKEIEARYTIMLQREKERIEKLRDKELAQIEKEKSAYYQLNKEHKEAAKVAQDLGAEYFRLEQQLEKLEKEIIDTKNAGLSIEQLGGKRFALITQMENLGSRAKSANEEAMKLHKGLLSIDQAVGKSQRNVGNYNAALSSVLQLLREAPSFAVSTATGILAISNNIPAFEEAVKGLKEVNVQLVAAGKEPIPIWKSLGSAIFSTSGIISIATTAATFLAFQMGKMKSAAGDAAKAVDKYKEALTGIDEQTTATIAKEQAHAETLLATAKNVQLSARTRIDAAEELKKSYSSLFALYTDQEIMAGKAAIAEQKLTEVIVLQAQARAYADKIGEAAIKAANVRIAQTQAQNELMELETRQQKILNQLNQVQYGKGEGLANAAIDVENKILSKKKELTVMNKQLAESEKELNLYRAEAFKAADAINKLSGNTSTERTREAIQRDIDAAEQIRDTTAKTSEEHKKAVALLVKLNFEMDVYLNKTKKDRTGASILEGIDAVYQARRRNEMAIADLEKQRYLQQAADSRLVYENEANSLEMRLDAYDRYQQAQIMIATIENAKEVAIVQDKLAAIAEKEKEHATGKVKLNKYELEALRLDEDTYNKELIAKREALESKLTDITAKGFVDRQAITQNAQEQQRRKTREFITSEQTQLEERLADYQDMYTVEATDLAKSYLNKEMGERAFREKLQKLRLHYNKIELEARIAEDEFLLKQDNLTGQQRLEIQRRLNRERQQLANNQIEQASSTPQYSFGLTESDIELANQVLQISGQLFQVEQAITDLVTQRYQKEIDAIERKRDALKTSSQEEIDLINNSLMLQTEKEQKIAFIRAETAAQERAYIQQQNELKRRQAIAEKAAATGQVIQQTAVAVMAALKIPPPVGPIVAAGIGVTGGIQLGKILATEIPAYGDGVQDKPTSGLAWVGERYEPEIVQEPGKAPYVVDTPTLLNLPKHTSVIPQEDIHNAMASMGGLSPMLIRNIAKQQSAGGAQLTADIIRLEKSFDSGIGKLQKTISDKTETHFHWSNGELRKSIKRGNNWTQIIGEFINNS